MTCVEELAAFVASTTFDVLSESARSQLKIRVLDALGCAIGAIEGQPVGSVRAEVTGFPAARGCTLIGGGSAAPDHAALLNGALVRHLDFNDSYLAPGESCHPSDALGAVLAASELAQRDGRDLMTALATAYQVQCRLSDVAPLRQRGFDHTVHLAFGAAAGASRALGLDAERTAHAVAISGTALNALRVARTGALSNWQCLAAPFAGGSAMRATLLAARGVTGPLEIFEGDDGFMQTISGPFSIDWTGESLDRVTQTITRKYCAEIHAQSAIEGIIALQRGAGFSAADVARIDVEIFDVAYRLIGGGEDGDKTLVFTREEADHSLPYLLAVALLDGTVMPEQFALERIQHRDVQALLCLVTVRPRASFSRRFPAAMPCRIAVALTDGRVLTGEMSDYPGFVSQPVSWETARAKFTRLAEPFTTARLRARIAALVEDLERARVDDLTALLAQVRGAVKSGSAGRTEGWRLGAQKHAQTSGDQA